MSSVASILNNTPAVLSPQNGGGGGASGVTSIVAGTNVTISPVGGTGAVTINATAGAGVSSVTSDPATSGITCTNTAGAVVLTNTGLLARKTALRFQSALVSIGTVTGAGPTLLATIGTAPEDTGNFGSFTPPVAGLYLLTGFLELQTNTTNGITWASPTTVQIGLTNTVTVQNSRFVTCTTIGNTVPSAGGLSGNSYRITALVQLDAVPHDFTWTVDKNVSGADISASQILVQVEGLSLVSN